jgi:hypothetical protein
VPQSYNHHNGFVRLNPGLKLRRSGQGHQNKTGILAVKQPEPNYQIDK